MGEVMVTGATGGIGRAIVSPLTADGDQVIAIGRDAARLRSLDGVQAMAVDLAGPQRLDEAIEPPARLDALVCCAGVPLSAIAPVGGTGAAVWEETMAVNVVAAARVDQAGAARTAAQPQPRGVRQLRARCPGSARLAFAASEAALQELADSLREEEAGNGVRVTTSTRGGTATGHLRDVRAAFGGEYDAQRLIRRETLAAMVAWVLGALPDAYVGELSVLAGPHGA